MHRIDMFQKPYLREHFFLTENCNRSINEDTETFSGV